MERYTSISCIINFLRSQSNLDKIFFYGDSSISYSELLSKINKLTTLFNNLSVKKGDRIIISTKNDLHASIILIAALSNGISFSLFAPDIKYQKATNLISKVNPKLIFIDYSLRSLWNLEDTDNVVEIEEKQQFNQSIIYKLLKKNKPDPTSFPGLLLSLNEKFPEENPDPDMEAYLIFTSGTISQQNCVVITHKNLFSHLKTLSNLYNLNEKSRLLNILMLSHADGLVQGPLLAFYNFISLYRPFDFSIQNLHKLLDSIYTYRITHFVTVPTVLAIIYKLVNESSDFFNTDDFQFLISTGAYLDKELWNNFENKFSLKLTNVYGLTETVAGAIFSCPSNKSHKAGTIGKPVDCEAAIINEFGLTGGPYEPGELLLKGDNVMNGYLNDKEYTFTILKEGWFYTGDIAVYDDEGFYSIVGRKKNIIISRGINIHPEEITEIIKKHTSVEDALTFGENDEIYGERIISAVSLYEGCTVIKEELMEFCRNNLEGTKIPDEIHILGSLPKGAAGKVKIEEVKNIISQIKEILLIPERSIELQIIQIASKSFKVSVDCLKMTTTPNDTFGWDSLSHLEFTSDLEKAFNIKLSPIEIMQIKSLTDSLSIVKSKLR